MVLKDGKRKPFLGKIFEKRGHIIGYEFVPEEVASSQQGTGCKLFHSLISTDIFLSSIL